MLLSGRDILGELADPVADDFPSDGAGEGLTAEGDELLSLLETESGAAMVFQDSGDRLWARGDERIRIANDAVIINAGGILPTAFLREIGIDVETKFGTA